VAKSVLSGQLSRTTEAEEEKLLASADLFQQRAKQRADLNTVNAGAVIRMNMVLVGLATLVAAALAFIIFRTVNGAIKGVLDQMATLTAAATAGQLTARADESAVFFELRPAVINMNHVLDAVIRPLNVAAGYVDRICEGRHPAQDHRPLQRRLQHDQEQPQHLHRRAVGADQRR
jgi:methyl-accepting chemotaxis protein